MKKKVFRLAAVIAAAAALFLAGAAIAHGASDPLTKDTGTLLWKVNFGTGWTASPTPPVYYNKKIYTVADGKAHILSAKTGKILASSEELIGSTGYAIQKPVLKKIDGKRLMFIHAGQGRVQCLDADTLESLWISEPVYNTVNGKDTAGQTVSPITVSDDMIYTGTWTGEKTAGSYFCMTVTDDDPAKPDEIKPVTWVYKPEEQGDGERGFYFAGAYAGAGFIVFGSDDGAAAGTDSTSVLYSLDKKTGKPIDKITDIAGDIRSSIVFKDGYLYFSTTSGRLYKVRIYASGIFYDDEISYADLGGAMTSSPVISDGRIYIGVRGGGNALAADGGHFIAVLNNTETLSRESIAYTVKTPGYVQSEVTVKPLKKAGSRVYFTYNFKPGGISYFDDLPESESAKVKTLYKPKGDLSQYCISPITTAGETLLYKNDSGYVFAFGRRTFTLKKTSITLKRGKSYKVAVKAMKPKVTIKYKSKNKKIATVSKKGVIKAKKKGKTVISATANGITRKITVKVK